MDIAGNRNDVVDDFGLEKKLWKYGFDFSFDCLELVQEFFASTNRSGLEPSEELVGLLIQHHCSFHQTLEVFKVLLAAFDFLVHYNTVVAFLRRLGQQFFSNCHVFFGRETQAVSQTLDLAVRLFDTFENLA